ncbi:probable disease resistance protein At4g27220 isoform X3 [Vitis riparia]|uniref:probable disease resistance protein At4g27220 isoform X3 n=1 Tax=Vitis riparia TaxID=96939 RepID=UPI00155A1EFB|nr:probable disease resistance protein At4g27220 isoform X3 [Vitis riparia]
MVEIVLSVAAKVSEYLVDPAVRQLGYLFNYRANIEDLSQQVQKLSDARARLQHSVDEAIGNGHIIEDDVCKWMERADGFIDNACKFLEDEKEARKSCFNGLCPNLKSRYRLSREARKKAGVSVQILGDGQFEKLSYQGPLQGIRSAPSEALGSRMLTLNEVMEALRDAKINKIGVWGLGGVGKTTLVKQVAEQAAQKKLFDKVVTADVLETPDLKKIQGELADFLGMKFEEESEQGRAARLYQRMKEIKTILIILDDIWAKLDLEKIGIPSPDHHKGCKLVLTSRNEHILSNEMDTQKDFRVQPLQEDETWILFKNTAGSIENPELQPIAVDVAKECAGLPLAIVTVAAALKGEKSVSIWEDARLQLKSQTSTNVTGLTTNVYSSLKLSYEHLKGVEVKSFFLLCGLISQNDIHIRDLLKYGVGLRLFQGTNTLEEAKNRIDTLVDNLKSSNFLLETGHNAVVRMHDLVRSTARKIAFEQRHVFTHQKTTVRVEEWSRIDELQVTWVNLHRCDIHELPKGLVCPKLEFFECFLKTQSAVKIPNTFFEGMKQLKVLDLTRMQLPSLPLSLQCLANLRTLCLDGCKLGDIVIIAELKKLEILSLMYSDIEKLPREIAQLTHLRLFDLKGSYKLKVIPPDVISSLSQLEDLCMENSFTQWEGEGKSNACLAELKHLSHLTALDIQISDAKLLPKDIVFDTLVRYRIFVGDVWSWGGIFEANKTLKLNKFDTSLHLVDGIIKLLKRTEDLHLRELCGGTNVLSKLDGEGFLKLKHLNVESSPEIQYIVNSMDLTPSHGAFPVMETLSLNQLINLQEVCHGQFPVGSFGCLRKVEVEDCDGLKFLFPLSVARGLSRLEETKVTRCKSMVEMVSQGRKEIKEDVVNVPLFLELRSLTLEDLPKLSNFCFEENPVLSKPASTIVGPSTPPLNQPEIRDGQLLLSLGGNLRSLKLKNCMSLLKLFPPSLLQNLQELTVEDCDKLEQVFDLEELNVDDGHVELLPKLKELTLIGLPKLRHICNCGSSKNHFSSSMASAPVGNIIFPKLSDILLKSLPNLTSFVSPGYHSLQRLHHADLDTPFPVLFDERVAFPNLEELALGQNRDTETWPEQFPVDSFPRLRFLGVYDYRDILVVIPSFMLQRLHNLEVLKVKRCSSVKEVFQLEGLDEENQAKRLARLREIWLFNLPRLTHLWKENSKPGPNLQSLESLEVLNCESLINLVPSSVSFQNLATLDVQSCGSLRSLISPSVAKSLVKLKTLKIGGSDMMEEVVANEAGEATDEITFYKLQHMELLYLPNLTSFSSGGYIFSFPSLEQMLVKECPKMKMFSSSLVTTPRLERIKVGDDEWPCQDDLNTAIHNSFINAHGNVKAEIVELGAGSAL